MAAGHRTATATATSPWRARRMAGPLRGVLPGDRGHALFNAVPDGHGRIFGANPVAAWAHIATVDGRTAERTAALTAIRAGDSD